MQLWIIKSARATIGGPILESRTPCKAAVFHWTTTFGDCANPGIAPAMRIANARTQALRKPSRRVLGLVISIFHLRLMSPSPTPVQRSSASHRVVQGILNRAFAVGRTEKKRGRPSSQNLDPQGSQSESFHFSL